ncbi:MAG: hypothetical protein AAB706_00680 [Patescibacteria group bacterium]
MPQITGGNVITDAAQLLPGVVASSEILNDSILDADINSTAAIARTKLANVSATARLLGRNTAGAGAEEELTLTQVLDFIGSATKGDILVRDTSAWARLAAGAANLLFTSNGAGALPTWTAFAGVTYKNGVDSYAGATGNQTIAHGLGVTPRILRIRAAESVGVILDSYGIYNGTTTSGWSWLVQTGTTQTTVTSTINIITIDQGGGTNMYVATATMDATNITLAWTKSGSPGTVKFTWEVEG